MSPSNLGSYLPCRKWNRCFWGFSFSGKTTFLKKKVQNALTIDAYFSLKIEVDVHKFKRLLIFSEETDSEKIMHRYIHSKTIFFKHLSGTIIRQSTPNHLTYFQFQDFQNCSNFYRFWNYLKEPFGLVS